MKRTVLVAALMALAVVVHADSGSSLAANVTVNVGDFWFCNSSFQSGLCPTSIRSGDTVTWNWVGSFQHTSTACSDGSFTTCGAAQGWDSGVKTTGTFSQTFNSAGTFYYRCNLHPGTMLGRIDVLPDTDGDGWSDAAESLIGTNPTAACGANAWPPDINNDSFVDIIADIVTVANFAFQSVPSAPARYDIAPDPPNGSIGIIDDIARIAGLFGQSCGP